MPISEEGGLTKGTGIGSYARAGGLLASLGTSSPFFLANTSKTLFMTQAQKKKKKDSGQYVLTSLGLRHAWSFHCFISTWFGSDRVTTWPVKGEKSASTLPIWDGAV